mmetsp:Transcript_12159/g.15759  ORF Transcript_12159/g.15759 Transcript_12159/m.15759 type:complete len:380 (+) Transcript_12159:39-1178(+)
MSDKDVQQVLVQENVRRSCPVTIVTGFLGSGKTTLLNYILTDPNHGQRIAVVENEFGEQIGVERLVAKDGKGGTVDLDDLFVELSNGCICCAVKDNLVTTLEGLLKRAGDKFDHIIIETSGLADPGPLAAVFWLDEELESQLFLNGIVTVVDLKNLERHLDDPHKLNTGYVNEALKQISYADQLLLNKTDLVSSRDKERTMHRIRQINPLAQVHCTKYSRVNLDTILNIRGFELDSGIKCMTELQSSLIKKEKQASGINLSSDLHVNHSHDKLVQSVVVKETKPLDFSKVKRWIGELLWEPDAESGLDIFRVKGILNIHNEKHIFVVQAVHETFEIEASKELWTSKSFENEDRESRIIFIGRNLKAAKLSLRACVYGQT